MRKEKFLHTLNCTYFHTMKSSRKRSDLDEADDIDSDDLEDGDGNSEDKIRLLRPKEDLETGLGQGIRSCHYFTLFYSVFLENID